MFGGKLKKIDKSGIFIDYECSKIAPMEGDGLLIYAKKRASGFAGADEEYEVFKTDFSTFLKKHFPEFDTDAYFAELSDKGW